MSLKFGQIQPRTEELAALEHLKKFPYTYYGENDIIMFSLLFLIGSFSLLQVTRTYIKPWMSSNVGLIPPLTKK